MVTLKYTLHLFVLLSLSIQFRAHLFPHLHVTIVIFTRRSPSQDARILLTNFPAARIAMLTSCAFKLKYQIKTGSLKPLIGQGLVPLCSTQYKDLFGTTRIPGKQMGMW